MIKVSFKSYNSYVTDSLYQWDLNRVLEVGGLNLSTAPEIHFSNSIMDKAIVRQAILDKNVVRVEIPNSLLQSPLTIEAHVGIYEDNAFKVIEKISIPVNPKKRPADYRIENTDEEIYSFNELRNMIENIKIPEYTPGTGEGGNSQITFSAGALYADKWVYITYDFEDLYPSDQYNIEIAVNADASLEQIEAFNSAMIVGGLSSNFVKAYGTVPTIDIPITVKAVTK